MKEEVKRFTEPALVRRARGAITRAMGALEYRRGGGGIHQCTTPDCRHAGAEWAPAVHADLQPGDLVDVIIGPEARDHRGTMRIFHRADGGGRFVLREAQTKPEKQDEQHQLALSLNRRTQGLLAGLVEGASLPARVIPRPQAGCATITFLELLHAHWNSRAHRSQKFEVPQADGRTASRRYYQGARSERSDRLRVRDCRVAGTRFGTRDRPPHSHLPGSGHRYPAGQGRGIIGKGGEKIRRLQSTPGTWAADFDNESSTFLAIGKPTALTAVLAEVAAQVSGATGRMTLASPSCNGRLIGRPADLLERDFTASLYHSKLSLGA